MAENEFKYYAFLSYSSQDNCEPPSNPPAAGRRCWGNWLDDTLKSFCIPPEFIGQINGRGEIIPERIAPIFRDDSELPGDAGLTPEICRALEQSASLVVVCSPRSAQSRQVNEVVRYFKQLGREKQILPIVVAGEPNAGTGNKSGASPADECYVPALRHPVKPDGTLDTARRAGKHIFVDARHGVEKREILANDHRHAEADLEMAMVQLIALLIGVGFDGLWKREQKRHFFDLSDVQHQARQAQDRLEEVQRQLQEARLQTREAQNRALELQNLPRDVQGQIQEAQNQAQEAQQQASEARKQLHESQIVIRETQVQLEEVRQRARIAEGKALETQNQAKEIQNQLEAARNQAREAQNTSSQLEETGHQARDAQDKLLAVQNQAHELQAQAQAAQSQLAEAREQVREAQGKFLEAQNQTRAAQDQVREIQNRTQDAQSQIEAAQIEVRKTESRERNARRLTRVFALMAALALLAAGTIAGQAWRQHRADSQAVAKAAAEAAGNFDLPAGVSEAIQQTLGKIDGAEPAENRRRSLNHLAAGIPRDEIPEALKAASVVVDDRQRSHFQKWLLVRMSWADPVSAMTNAGAIEGKIVNDEGLSDSNRYFQLAVLDYWIRTDWPGAFNWVCQLPDADSRQCILEEIIFLVQSQPDSESRGKMIESCVGELAKINGPEALALVESLPEGAQRDTIIARLWMRTGPFSVLEWINSLGLPPEGMSPRQASWPWEISFLDATFGRPPFLPTVTGASSTPTNGLIQVQSQK